MKKRILFFLFLACSTFTVLPQEKVITIEGASTDPTLVVRGPEQKIAKINSSEWLSQEGLFLFTSSYGSSVESSLKTLTAIQVDGQMRVTELINPSTEKGKKPTFNTALKLSIPIGGFVLVANDDNYQAKEFKRFIAENFRKGDLIKLRSNGEIIQLAELEQASGIERKASLSLQGEAMRTTLTAQEVISGQITNFNSKGNYRIELRNGNTLLNSKPNRKGLFSSKIPLRKGTNYLDIALYEDNKLLKQESIICFLKEQSQQSSEVVLWVEQFPNAKVLTSDETVREMIQKAKEAGFTSIGMDVKGPEGYVSYRKSTLSKTPYLTATKNPNKRVVDNGFDLLQSVITEAHQQGLKVYASFNFFTEGNLTTQDFAILNEHRDWEEIVQRPEDKGELLAIRHSQVGKEAAQGKRIALAFVNPANPEVQDFQLLRVEEVLRNYAVDGVVLDRCRYDNLYADFSHTTRNLFAAYLTKQGKQLENFPTDAFRINEQGAIEQGKYFTEWITFRSEVIKEFVDRVRLLVNRYKRDVNPNLQLAAYVGSWYEVYYQNGVNWASPHFTYDNRLNFPESKIYTPSYQATSYLSNLDFLMIGTYFKTEREVNRYITLGNILTQGDLPLIGSMSLPDLKQEEQGEVFKASLTHSAGVMIFDLCYIQWPSFIEQMKKALGKSSKR